MTSTPFEPPKRGRRARVLVVEQPGEGLWRAQQADRQARLLDELVGGRGDRRLRTGSAVQQEFTA